ncbi:prephenate dehydratase domain-containing protein [Mycoplasmatota bacterium WC30]
MIRVGYQGIQGSNSEEAAIQLVKKHNFDQVLFLPLVSSFNVLDNVNNGNIDYGVIAIRNNTGGTVTESIQTLKFLKLTLFDKITLPIHHYLYVKDKEVKENDIKIIASHPQAFIQCKANLKKYYPNVLLLKDEDTATAARKLGLELFDRNTAILCRRNAGEFNNLFLMKSHLEDRNDNTTDFEIYKK